MANKSKMPDEQFTAGQLIRTTHGLEDLDEDKWPFRKFVPKVKPAPREALDRALDFFKDVEVSDELRRDHEERMKDEQMYQQLIDQNSTEEQKASAREYLDARDQEILRQNALERGVQEMRERSLKENKPDQEPEQQVRGGTAKRFAKGAMNTASSIFGCIRGGISDARASKTGDIDVSAYTYKNENGKTVHVKAHKRKRS